MIYPLRFTTMHADTSQAPAYIAGRKDKDARTRLDIYANFTPVTEGRSMKDACGCLVLESFNTTRGVMVGRETTRSKSKRQNAQARGIVRKRERRNKREESKREGRLEKGNISNDWYCRRCARCGAPWGGIGCIQMGWLLELC